MSIKGWPCWAKIGLAVGLAVFSLNWPSTSSEWAAWVQAIGSIGTIGVAIYVLKKQAEHQRQMQRNEWKLRREERLGVSKKVYAPVALSVLSIFSSNLRDLTDQVRGVDGRVKDLNNIARMTPVLNKLRVQIYNPALEFLYIEDSNAGVKIQEMRAILNSLCAFYDQDLREALTGEKTSLINSSELLQVGNVCVLNELESLMKLCCVTTQELSGFIHSQRLSVD